MDGSSRDARPELATVATVPVDWLRWRTRDEAPPPAVFVPMQTVYKDLVKEMLSPGFRRLGLIGSGGRYSLKSDCCWALLGLQKSAFSDASDVRFTANLLVVSRAAWSTTRADRPDRPERP